VAIPRDLGQRQRVVHVQARDVDVQEDRVAEVVLPLQQVLEVPPDRRQRLRQPGPLVHDVHRQVDRRHARVAQPIGHLRLHQPPVGRQVDEEAPPHGVVHQPVHEGRPQQGLPAHDRQRPTADVVQPVHRPARHRLRHPLHAVVPRPAVVAVEVALPLGEQVREQRAQRVAVHLRPHVRPEPAPHRPAPVERRVLASRHRRAVDRVPRVHRRRERRPLSIGRVGRTARRGRSARRAGIGGPNLLTGCPQGLHGPLPSGHRAGSPRAARRRPGRRPPRARASARARPAGGRSPPGPPRARRARPGAS
jgi:hypothetical protein